MTQIYLTTLNLTDSSVTFAVDGKRYEYFLTRPILSRIEVISRRSGAKALNFAKRHAMRWQELM